MEYVFLKARAKINVSLDVTSKRADGYHDMKMIMQTLSFYDSVLIRKVYKPDYLKLVTNLPWLPTDENNLACRAAKYLIDMFGIKTGIFIELKKSIPVSAGLAGGSSDCAAVLVGMRNMFNLPLANWQLAEIGKTFGADVPFCIMRGTALAEGIGERLTKLPPMPPVYVLLAKPPFSVSTADVFRRFRLENVQVRPDTEKIIRCLEQKDLAGICGELCNVLETVTSERYPIIGMLKNAMLEAGGMGSLMSGSGPTVFGFYKTRQAAVYASAELRKAFPVIRDIYVTRTWP